MFFESVKQKNLTVKNLIPVYEIVPSPLYGWNFKCAESRHVIKFLKERNELLEYAAAYCKTHSSELFVYNYFGEINQVIRFEPENLKVT